MIYSVFKREYWYNYFDVDLLLKNESKDQIIVCDAASSDPLHQSHIIRKTCKDLLEINKSIKSAVIPINIGNVIDGIYEGSHWVGLVININPDKSFEALYVDSFGENINETLYSVLTSERISTIKNLSRKQQYNDFDCGPWVVFNLISIAKTGDLPIGIDEEMILKQRSTLRLLLNEKPEECDTLNISDFPLGNSILTNSANLFKNNQSNNLPLNDIDIILEMKNSITNFLNKKINLQNCLVEIGNLSEQISYNDNNDPQSKSIRNKYGYIQRNRNKQKNINGIYFEKIFQLKIIFSDDEVYSRITQQETDRLCGDLINLKIKLNKLLLTENSNESTSQQESILDGLFMNDIIEIANKYYNIKIFRRIREIIGKIDSINFSVKEDRYFIARILTVIGQLLNEFLESQSINFRTNKLFNGFQDLMNIRNLIVHSHLKIKCFTENETQISILNDSIISIKDHLEKIIMEDFHIDFQYENSENLIESTKKILNYLKKKSKPDLLIDTNNELIKIISKSLKVIERAGLKPKDDNQLLKSNNEYQNLLNRLDAHDRCNYPESLSISNKNILKEFINSRVQKVNIKQSEKTKKEKLTATQNKVEIKSFIDDLLWKSYKIITNSSIDSKEIDQKLSVINKQYRSKLNQLDLSNSHAYPDQLNYSNKNIIIKYNEPKIKDKMLIFIKEINDEIIYLESIENNIELIEIKKMYICEHIVLVIGQIVRDLLNLGLCNYNSLNLPGDKWFVSRCISSEILSEAGRSARRSRNEGLAHNIWSFDRLRLWKTILNDLLPASNYLEKLFHINESESLPLSVYSSFTLGILFTDIGLYTRAIEYLQKALVMLNDVSDTTISDTTNDYSVICGMNHFLFQIHTNLAHVYRLIGQYKDATEILELLLSKINYQQVISCQNEILKKEVSHVYVDICYLHTIQFNYKKVIEICDKAIVISGDFEIGYYLAIALWEDGQINRAIEEMGKLKGNNDDPVKSYIYLETIAVMCLDKLENEKYFNLAIKCIENMENLLENNIKDFKINNPHQYLLQKLIIYHLKCKIIMAESLQKLSYNIDSLTDIIRLANETIGKLNADLKRDRIVCYIYICFCAGYLCYFYLNKKKYHVLLNAERFFDQAVETAANLIVRLPDIDQQLIDTAEKLSDSFVICNEHVDSKQNISYIEKSLLIKEKYKLNKLSSYHCLSRIFCNLGIDCYNNYMDNKNQKSFDEALIHFKKSIKFCKLKKAEPISENALQVIALKDDVTVMISQHVNIDTAKYQAMSYNRIGVLTCDIFLMKKSIRYYNKLLSMNLSTAAKDFYENQKNKCQMRITSVISTLEFLVSDSREVFVTDYSVEFLCWKFPGYINEENCQELFGKTNQSLIDNLSPFIKRELTKFSENFLVLYKFCKLLIKRGLIQKFPEFY